MWLSAHFCANHTSQHNFLRGFLQPSPHLKTTLPFLHWHFMDQKSPSRVSGNTHTCSRRADRALLLETPRYGQQQHWRNGKSRWNSARTKEITTAYATLTTKSHQAIQCNPLTCRKWFVLISTCVHLKFLVITGERIKAPGTLVLFC